MWLAGDKDTISATTVADAVAQWSALLKDIGWDIIIGNGTVLKDIVVWDIIRNIYPLLFFHIFLKGKV